MMPLLNTFWQLMVLKTRQKEHRLKDVESVIIHPVKLTINFKNTL